MIECIEDAGPAEVREAEDRQRAQMTPPEHRFESADERRVREQTVEIDRRFGHRDVVETVRDRAMQIGQRLAIVERAHRRHEAGKQVENPVRSEEHTSELQSIMHIWYAGFCLK